jgi:hypothetical protein
MTRTLEEQKTYLRKWIGVELGDLMLSQDKQEKYVHNEALDYLYSILEVLERT